MRNVTISKTIAAPPADVWAVLADFPNIANWNSGVKTSYATGEAVEGVGATRHCDLSPAGRLEESIAEWVPEERLVVNIDEASRIPIKRGVVTFTLDGGGDGGAGETRFTLSYDYLAKGGPVASLVGAMMGGQLRKGFTGFIDDLEVAAQSRATT
ncbi:MAG: SRPBCC family protein [Acidimicrobiales bacterium]